MSFFRNLQAFRWLIYCLMLSASDHQVTSQECYPLTSQSKQSAFFIKTTNIWGVNRKETKCFKVIKARTKTASQIRSGYCAQLWLVNKSCLSTRTKLNLSSTHTFHMDRSAVGGAGGMHGGVHQGRVIRNLTFEVESFCLKWHFLSLCIGWHHRKAPRPRSRLNPPTPHWEWPRLSKSDIFSQSKSTNTGEETGWGLFWPIVGVSPTKQTSSELLQRGTFIFCIYKESC